MSNGSPTPWTLVEREYRIFVLDAESQTVFEAGILPCSPSDPRPHRIVADYSRVVQCVNALHGLEPSVVREVIERIAPHICIDPLDTKDKALRDLLDVLRGMAA